MRQEALEALSGPLAEVGAFVFYTLVAGLLTALGVAAETFGVQNLLGDQTMLGLWFVVVGGLLLYGGVVLLGYGKVYPRLRRTARAVATARR